MDHLIHENVYIFFLNKKYILDKFILIQFVEKELIVKLKKISNIKGIAY